MPTPRTRAFCVLPYSPAQFFASVFFVLAVLTRKHKCGNNNRV
ncbi:hypothetical protein Z945_3060 [Sulfitobacter noctilucae]|nr:hypothetical protein Z945_3060 [Sulfitobacter noctilucae]